jgi:D-serine deaminase-like pyridoxal phosphate-dependent protein
VVSKMPFLAKGGPAVRIRLAPPASLVANLSFRVGITSMNVPHLSALAEPEKRLMKKSRYGSEPRLPRLARAHKAEARAAAILCYEFARPVRRATRSGRNLDRDGAPTKAFEPSLFVWATVMSRPTEDRAIVDAGLKALAFD